MGISVWDNGGKREVRGMIQLVDSKGEIVKKYIEVTELQIWKERLIKLEKEVHFCQVELLQILNKIGE